jgi:hypothetical protein
VPRLNAEDCDHSGAHKEVISGQRTGEYVCDSCGESWASAASLASAQEAFRRKKAQEVTPRQTRVVPFTSADKAYEIRIYQTDNGFSVAGFLGDSKVTASYHVTMVDDFDFRIYHGEWAHDHLVAAVRDDIVNGRLVA